ncbi:hypothetical protein ACH5RR_032916 [Cinchona calisaya]|uniref:Uncharacterized protein n=1 Tax=Cinchona calisaya TaxID=153742 RepID=A0ABD2YNQ2_9GENT
MQSLLIPNQNIALTASAAQRKILPYNPEYHGQKFRKLCVLGPNYRANRTPFWEGVKEISMHHVLINSQCLLSEIMTEIGNIEVQIRAAYADNVVNGLTGSEVQKMMVMDGCFFLLLAFSILGAGTDLKFPENDPVFGTGCVNYDMHKWLKSMFFVGNQIPFMVLEKLMNLSFFKGLKTTLEFRQQLELGKRTLHKFLIVGQTPKPTDLIHCLQSIILGPIDVSNKAVGKKDDDIEDIVSASKLSKCGIKFRKLEGELGIRAVKYECNTFGAVLYLPVLKVDRNTQLLVKCLLKYETVQEPRGFEPEASSFFKFMRELIRASQDIEVLESEGIIQGQSHSLLGLLTTLDGMVSSSDMHYVKREIVGNRPWQWQKPLKWMAFIFTTLTFLFGFMQMNYGILAYYKPGKS